VNRVMELGYADTLARRDEIAGFLCDEPTERARARG
jgi:hypothetical protein